MGDPTELLAMRKEVLVARAALERLKIARDVEALRESLRWPRAAAAVAASGPARSALLAFLVWAGSGRAGSILRVAAGVVAAVRIWRALARRREGTANPGAQSPGTPAPPSRERT